MSRISIVLKISILFICLILFACVALGIGVYFRLSLIVDQDALKSIDYVYNLMDSALAARVTDFDSIVKDFSLNQAVRDYLRSPVVPVEIAKKFSEYVDSVKATRPNVYGIKVYKDGEKVIHTGGNPMLSHYESKLSDQVIEALVETPGHQYWMHDDLPISGGSLPVIRVFSSIYDLDNLRAAGVLEIELLSSSLFSTHESYMGQDLLVFLMREDNRILWGQDEQYPGFVDQMLLMQSDTQTVKANEGSFFVYRRLSETGLGSFYLAKLTNVMKSANRELFMYMAFIMAIVSAAEVLLVLWLSRKMLHPLVRLRSLVNHLAPEGGLSQTERRTMEEIKRLPNEVGELAASFDLFSGKIETSMRNIDQANAKLRKLELDLLMSWIKPHFLYNTIEVICGMARVGNTDEIYTMAKSLGMFYRLSLSKGENFLRVESELTQVESYINIERIRMDYAFEFSIIAQQEVRALRVLKLLVQPIVENAIQHGIRRMPKGGVLSVSAFIQDENLIYEVVDNGEGIAPDVLEKLNDGTYVSPNSGGFGVHNVRDRIQLQYGMAYGLTFFSEQGAGTRVRIVVPVSR